MGTRELEWIDVGDGAGGRAAQGRGSGKKPSAERRALRREEARLQVKEIRQGRWVGEVRKDTFSGEDRQRGAADRRKQAGMPDGQMTRQELNVVEEEWEEDPEGEWEEAGEEWEEDTGAVLPYREKESGGRRPEAEEDGRERQRKQRKREQQQRTLQQRAQQQNRQENKEQQKREQRQKKRRRARKTKRMLMVTSFFAVISIVLGITLAAVYIYQELKAGRIGGEVPAANVQVVEETPVPQDIRKWAPFYAASLERPAQQNKSYFQSLAETHERSASAHFIIGFDGVIVQCIPTAEIAYAVKERNYDSISIECCFLDESGQFTQETYDKLIELTAWLLHKFELEPEDVLRHYDEGGKICPKYYVEHEDAWQQFLRDLERYMERVAADAARSGQ